MKTKLFKQILAALIISVGIVSAFSCSSDNDDDSVTVPSLSIGMPDGSAAPTSFNMSGEGET